jgi:hypothetical protein
MSKCECFDGYRKTVETLCRQIERLEDENAKLRVAKVCLESDVNFYERDNAELRRLRLQGGTA